ncbi:MAG: NAD(P)H dehydrogenase, partial [Methanomassiliicoccales archaeon]
MRAMFIIGSPHGARSTSNSLADRLVKHLEEVGWETVKAMAGRAMSPTELNGRAVECLESDLLVIASPLYVDQLPSPCIEFMEAIRRESGGPGRRPDLAAVINCGFPEASQNRVALLICHEFALACGMTWRGGLSLGAGPMVGGRPLDQLGGALRNVATALDIAGEALSRGEDIS